MSDRAERVAEMIANHILDDAYADLIHEQAKLQLQSSQASLGGPYNLLEGDIEELVVTDAADITLTIPATATGASVQNKMDAGFESSSLCFTVDGTPPTLTNSLKLEHFKTALLGELPNHNGDTDELGNFTIRARAGETARIRVLYYEPK